MNQMYLGMPPPHVKKWIVDHQPENLSFWKQLRANLQDFPNQTLVQMSSKDDMKPGVLPAVGSTISTEFKNWINDDTWEGGDDNSWYDHIDFCVAGYNLTIPKRVKYINENGYVAYFPTMPQGDGEGDRLGDMASAGFGFSDMNGSERVLSRSGVSDQNFTYGNNVQFSAPLSIENRQTAADNFGTFGFAGYTMTLVATTPVMIYNEDVGIGPHLIMHRFLGEQWSGSPMRTWLNTDQKSECIWDTESLTAGYDLTSEGILARFPEQDFMDSVVPTVNKTWNGSTDEHTVDMFWIPSAGELGFVDQMTVHDAQCCTSKFTDLFGSKSDIKSLYSTSGTRTHDEDEAYAVFVDENGGIGASPVAYAKVRPCCTIGN